MRFSNTFWLNVICLILIYKDKKVTSDVCTCPDVCSVSNKEELGRSTWYFLHSIVENVEYTEENNIFFTQIIQGLPHIYPCGECRGHLKQMNLSPIKMTKQWMCEFHNNVSKTINKTLFNCSRY